MSSIQTPTTSSSPIFALVLATIIVGVGSGFLGMGLAFLLHYIQHIAYGYSPLHIISDESFLEGVTAASPLRRVIAMMLCGLIAGIGWWLLYRYGKPLVSIAGALSEKKKMPVIETIIHAFIQIITIALGSPLGREVAPRELGSIFAQWVSEKINLSAKEAQIMLACGAGAGLAAVYNVPLGGALFTLEVLLCTFEWSVVLPALATSAIAVAISWIGLGNNPIYIIPKFTLNYSLVIWSILTGPLFGYLAFWFIQIANKARMKAEHGLRMPVVCFINFTIIGLFAIYFPPILGNGKSPIALELNDPTDFSLSLILLILRVVICWSSLRVGAQGGLLTPSLANGALLAVCIGTVWNMFWPVCSLGAFAIIGAVAFLAAAQKMPLTAIVLIFEFTRLDLSYLIPIMFAVAGSVGMSKLCMDGFWKNRKIYKQAL